MKEIVLFWGKEKYNLDNPIDYGIKQKSYELLMESLSRRSASVYICSGYNNYLGENRYLCTWKYDASKGLIRFNAPELIEPDGVYDRSASLHFPGVLDNNVLNSHEFKSLCNDKWQSYMLFKEAFPRSYLLSKGDPQELTFNIINRIETDKSILKPIGGSKGNGIVLFNTLSKDKIFEHLCSQDAPSLILQEYVDSLLGIPGLVEGTHDLRLVYLGGQVIWSHIRTPKQGDFRSNVHLGGNIRELRVKDIPKKILNTVNPIAEVLRSSFNNPLFSIDVAMTSEGVRLYEFNDLIGFPTESMQSASAFTEALADRLIQF